MLPAHAVERIEYIHSDPLGSPIAATDENGELLWRERYQPYGSRELKQAPARERLWFTGKAEETILGLQDFGARWYDPTAKRFISMDPVGFTESNLQSFNRYAYANNNPYRYVDPDGRSPLLVYPAGLALGALVGHVITQPVAPGGSGAAIENQVPGFGRGADSAGWSRILSDGQSADAGSDLPPLPDVLVGDQSDSRAGQNKGGTKHTSGPLKPEYGGTGSFDADLERLTGGTRPWQPGDKAPPGSLVGGNGIFGRPKNSSGGQSIDIPANGARPHETLHYP